jgi:hypothetical protein
MRFDGCRVWRRRRLGRRREGQPCRPEDPVLNPEIPGNHAGDLLPLGHRRVEDSAAVVDHRFHDRLEHGVRLGRRVDHVHQVRQPGVVLDRPPSDTNDGEHLTGGRDGPLNELSARLLQPKCAEQLGRQRQRSAGAGGHSEKSASIDHERSG